MIDHRSSPLRFRNRRCRAALAVLTASAMAILPVPAAAQSSLERIILAEMNRERAAVGVPPLAWDADLAVAAAGYAPVLAAGGRLEHSPRSSRRGQSENLWMGTRGAFTTEQMVGYWAAEKARFRPGIFPNVSSTGNWFDVSHYSQMIWRGTTHVGCATARNAVSDFLVCRFSPRGNIDGQRVP